jgi:hypothetical protein
MAALRACDICGITTSRFCKRLILMQFTRCLISMQKQNFLTDQRLVPAWRHLATILSTESVRKWISCLFIPMRKKQAWRHFLKAIKHLGICSDRLLTSFSTICVQSLPGRSTGSQRSAGLGTAQKCCRGNISFKIKHFDLDQGPCSQYCPQNLCRSLEPLIERLRQRSVRCLKPRPPARPLHGVSHQGWDYTSLGALIRSCASGLTAQRLPKV